MPFSSDPPLVDRLSRRISRRALVGSSLLVGTVAARWGGHTAAQTEVSTKLVAAVDATDAEKAAANYQCDGVDDHLEIRAALASLPKSGGALLRLSSGHFSMREGNVTFNGYANLTVEGAGRDATLVANATDQAFDSEPLSFTRCPGAVVRNLTISAGGAARSSADALDFDDSNDCLVERVKVVASRGRGIVFDGKDLRADGTPAQSLRNVVRDCVVTGCTGAGIMLLATEQCQILTSICTGNASNGLWMHRSTTYGRRCFNNVVRGGEYSGNQFSGIQITEGDNNIIDGAVCRNNGSDGVRVQTTSTNSFPANTNQVRNCTCTDTQATKTQDYGVNLFGVPETDIDGTVIRDNDLRGNRVGPYKLTAVNTSLSGNLIDDPTATATSTPTATTAPSETAVATATSTPILGSGLFADGFESGTLSAWTLATGLVVQPVQVATGSYAAQAISAGTAAYARKSLSAVQTELYFFSRVRLNSKDSQSLYLNRLRTSGGLSILGIYVSGTGTLNYRNDIAGMSRTSMTPFTLGQWHTVESRVVINGAAGSVEVWLDGERVKALCQGENLGTAGAAILQIGDNATGRTFDVVFDDVTAALTCVGSCPDASTPTATPIAGAGLFADGFESGSLSAWTSSSGLVVQQSQVASGSYAARGTSSGTAAYARKTLSAVQTDLYYNLRFRLNSKDSTTLYLNRFRTAGNASIFGVYVSSTGRLGYRNDVGAVSRTSSTTVQTGVWHTLETHLVINGASSQVEVWLNGSRIDDLCRTENLGTAGTGILQLGEKATGRTFDVVFDDVTAAVSCESSCPGVTEPTLTSTAQPTNTPTGTATPTETPVSTETPESTSTPEPPTSTPTNTPTSTDTAVPPPDPTTPGVS